MWGIIPAAGLGTRIRPPFSKELLPVGSRREDEVERPRAVSEYLVERMVRGGATKLCLVIAPAKADILAHYGGSAYGVPVCYAVQERAAGLCDAVFRALPLVAPGEHALVGLPDTIWFPEDGFCRLDGEGLSFLLFPVERPEHFDAVVVAPDGAVREIQVKQPGASTRWVWGAFKLTGAVMRELYELWCGRDRADPYVGTLVNAYLARGGRATGVKAGVTYVDVGTSDGYREAQRLVQPSGR